MNSKYDLEGTCRDVNGLEPWLYQVVAELQKTRGDILKLEAQGHPHGRDNGGYGQDTSLGSSYAGLTPGAAEPANIEGRLKQLRLQKEQKSNEIDRIVTQLNEYGQQTDRFVRDAKQALPALGDAARRLDDREARELYQRNAALMQVDIYKGDALIGKINKLRGYAAQAYPGGAAWESRSPADRSAGVIHRSSEPDTTADYVANTLASCLAYGRGDGLSAPSSPPRPQLGSVVGPKQQPLSAKIELGQGYDWLKGQRKYDIRFPNHYHDTQVQPQGGSDRYGRYVRVDHYR